MIWLAEVASKQRPEIRRQIEEFKADANPELFRARAEDGDRQRQDHGDGNAHRLAGGQLARRRQGSSFSDAFLIVTPGITIKDRLRVLLPSDPQNYYRDARI